MTQTEFLPATVLVVVVRISRNYGSNSSSGGGGSGGRSSSSSRDGGP